MRSPIKVLSLSSTLSFCALSFAFAQTDEPIRTPEDDQKGVWSFVLENDLFVDEDNGYTNGARFSYLSPKADIPEWADDAADYIPVFAHDGDKRFRFAFGQSMFAPDDLTRRDLITDDRPYAGFLFGSVGLVSDTGSRLDNLQLTLGVVGPASLAEQTQKFVHKTIGSTDPKGWDNQLKNEPGIILSYERKWRSMYQLNPFGWAVDASPYLGGSLGNIYTHASTGAMFRIGYDLPSDYGPPLISPNLPGSDFFIPTNDISWYLFAGFEGRAVAQNIFLDGNSWQDSHSVDKKPLVGSIQAGIAFTYKDVRIAYTQILRTKEFKGQQNADKFGALTVSFRF